MRKTARPYEETFRIRSYEVDEFDRLAARGLCQYLQEVASHHARRLGVESLASDGTRLSWVLARMRIQMETMPSWGSELSVRTWPSGVDRLYAYRDFRIREGDRPIGAAVTHWLLIDGSSRRPARIPEEVEAIRLPDRERVLPEAEARPVAPKTPDTSERFTAHRFLIDVNRHVNSAVYLDWAVETVPEETWTERRLAELDVHFRAEARKGDRVEARAEKIAEDASGTEFAHRLVLVDGENELLRAHTRWERPQ